MPDLSIPSQRSLIEGLINGVPAHVNGQGIRIDVDDLRGILAKAYDAGEDSMRAYRAVPRITEAQDSVVARLVGRLSERARKEPSIQNALNLAYIAGEEKGRASSLMRDPRVQEHGLYVSVRGDEVILSCMAPGCTWDCNVGYAAEMDSRILPYWEEHLALVLDPLGDLPFGTYFDGTYQWEKDEEGWVPIHAPQGMPPAPERAKLKRVVTTYVDL